MPGVTRFVPNPALPKLLQANPILLPLLKIKADLALRRARAIAPVDTGTFRDSLQVAVGVDDGVARARLFSDDDEEKVIALEFGTSRTPTFATLRRAIDKHVEIR